MLAGLRAAPKEMTISTLPNRLNYFNFYSTYRIYKRGRGSYNGPRVGLKLQNHHPDPRPLSDPQITQLLTTLTKSVTYLYLIRHYKVLHRRLRTVSIGLLANVAGATMGKLAAVDHENEGTPAKLGGW